MTDESNLALFVNEGAVWNLLDSKVGDGLAVLVLHVVVLDVVQSLFLNECLGFFLVLINIETNGTNVLAPFGFVCSHHLLSCLHGNVAGFAPGCPELKQDDLVRLMADGECGKFLNFRGALDKAHFLVNFSSAEDVNINRTEPLNGLSNFDIGISGFFH